MSTKSITFRFLLLMLFPIVGFSQSVIIRNIERAAILFADDFSAPLNSDLWHIEMEERPNSSVFTQNKHLVLDTRGGVTVWLKKLLEGDFLIEYNRKVLVGDGPNDRLSDLNQFWMATDPRNPDLFTRKGKFVEYDSISMYYVGFGGNTNTTNRFRKYMGNGEKVILDEKNHPTYLLEANKEYKIQILVRRGIVAFWVDDTFFFEYNDPEPLSRGYFGFRSTWSRQEISNLKIYQID